MKVLYLVIFIFFGIVVLAQESETCENDVGVYFQVKFSFEIKSKPDPLSKSIAQGMAGDFVKITGISTFDYYCVNYKGLSGYIDVLYLANPEEMGSFEVEMRKKLLIEEEKEEEKKEELNDLIEHSYDEFTGEVLIKTKMNGPINFAKSISETGKSFIILKWNSSVRGEPKSEQLQLIILFDDNSRLSISLPIVSKYDEFWSSFYLKIAMGSGIAMNSTVYRLTSEVLLTPLQIEILKNKTIKKYRLEGFEGGEVNNRDPNSNIIFNKLLNAQ